MNVKSANRIKRHPLHPWSFPSRPWSRAHIDHAGLFMGKTFLQLSTRVNKLQSKRLQVCRVYDAQIDQGTLLPVPIMVVINLCPLIIVKQVMFYSLWFVSLQKQLGDKINT